MNNRWLKGFVAAFWLWAFALLATAQQAGETSASGPVVYVSDFELDAASITPDQSRVSRARRFAGSLSPLHLSGQDPQKKSQALVTSMADRLVADLQHDGIDARRLPAGGPLPAQGWLVRGVFLAVDEGNRVRRAVVGFGAGQGKIELAVAIDGLPVESPTPLYQTVEGQSDKHAPGAMIKLNPYVVAARYAMAGNDQQADIEQAASQVAEAVVARVKTRNTAAPQP
ncbi:DUF4410 domain-containing protein [Paraburkholderia phymatum]|uniref:Conserved hypothetical secreted protein n=1 Tax=Paraburkholderia phymatum (strain DSM 17167 / CIP 108236 / LMG 21445 / STM815) TaxID=391038 RepID=B2JUP5_PARP8|nr:DUF4410 domain-containing protein [Paraburkholderia phymatum]ACC76216.1 conserved hypothetical secreted protein [Paraburkholderia phymatum STM815]